MKSALVVNPGSLIGVSVVGKLVRLGYSVTAITPESSSYLAKTLPDTNPEFYSGNQYTEPKLIVFEDSLLESPVDIIEKCRLEELAPIDVVISLNQTEQSFVKWDLILVDALFKQNYIKNKDGVVIFGRDSDLTASTENVALEKAVWKMAPEFTKAGINFNNCTQIGALPGDESYVADSYVTEVMRNEYKVDKVNSPKTLLCYALYYYVPGFLLGLVFYVKDIVENYLPALESQSADKAKNE